MHHLGIFTPAREELEAGEEEAAIGPMRVCIAEFLIAGEFKGKCQFCHPSPHPEAGQIQKGCSCSGDLCEGRQRRDKHRHVS